MQTNDVLRHKRMKDVEIRLLQPKGNGYQFQSPTHGVSGLWSSRYIESAFDLVSTDQKQESV